MSRIDIDFVEHHEEENNRPTRNGRGRDELTAHLIRPDHRIAIIVVIWIIRMVMIDTMDIMMIVITIRIFIKVLVTIRKIIILTRNTQEG